MSTVFLIGAGASFGSGPCSPAAPPLGANFFDELAGGGGVASTVSEELAEIFRQDFERGMDLFFEERNTDVTPFLREMAQYFCKFEPLEGNAYRELIKILGKDRKKATFVTTNYDLLIEMAATQEGMEITYGRLSEAPKNNLPVLKIHGSCNFLPDLRGGSIRGLAFAVSADQHASILEVGVKVASSTREVLDFCEEEDSIAPALAMYSPDKRILYCKRFVEQQRDAWKIEAARATRIYIIGLKVHPIDEHIWGVLAKCPGTKYYVGGEPDEFRRWTKNTGAENCFCIARRFDEALPTIARHLNSKWRPNRDAGRA